MSYDTERRAIETYFAAQWGATTPLGMIDHPFEPAADSVQLGLLGGRVLQGSVGRVANRKDHVGVLTATIFTEGDRGRSAWTAYAETMQGFLEEVTIDSAGAAITATADAFVRFSPPGLSGIQHPYVQSSTKEPPFTRTVVAAPFVRYEYR